MDNYCPQPETLKISELSVARLDIGTIQSERGVSPPRVEPNTASASLPGLDLVDGQGSSTDSAKICLTNESNNPKPFAALTSVSLANCSPEFKVLVENLQKNCDPADQELRSQTAQELIKIARQDEKYSKVLEPFMNDLFNQAYPFPKMSD